MKGYQRVGRYGTSCLIPTHVCYPQLYVEEVYDSSSQGRYTLHSMFCYYGQHYHAFIRKDEVRSSFIVEKGGAPEIIYDTL